MALPCKCVQRIWQKYRLSFFQQLKMKIEKKTCLCWALNYESGDLNKK